MNGVLVLDNIITLIDRSLKTLCHAPHYHTVGGSHIGRLMRVNYAGEVAAQGLYLGAWFISSDLNFRQFCMHSMQEEAYHLDWCLDRMQAYQTAPSVMNPLIYAASFGLGVGSTLAGSHYALGFVEETETQVLQHLVSHQQEIPLSDTQTHEVIAQMLIDEQSHQSHAKHMGAEPLPNICKAAMHVMGRALTTLSYWI